MSETSHNSKSLELITRHQRALYGYILSLVSSRDLADEILQETNVVLCRKIDQYDHRAKFITWACRIAYFEVLAARKRIARHPLRFVDDSLLEDIADRAATHASQADERLRYLRECIEELSPHSQTLLDQRYSHGGSVARIAEATSRSPGGVSVSLHRIRKHLFNCMEQKVMEAR